MRVTESLVYSRLRRETGIAQSRYDQASLPLLTGQKHSRPSDDPSYAAEMAHLERGMARTEQYTKAIDRLDAYYGVVESHVQSTVDLLSSMTTRAIQMKNDSYDAEDRLHAAQEVGDALDQLTALASASQDGRFVFSGRKQGAPPFDATGAFQGDPVGRQVPVSDGVELEGDLTAPAVFGDLSGDASAFRALQGFKKALETNDGPGLDVAIAELRKATDHATRAWSKVGSLRAEMLQLTSFHEDQRFAYETRRGQVGAVDYAASATALKFAEDTYSASISVAQKVAEIVGRAWNY